MGTDTPPPTGPDPARRTHPETDSNLSTQDSIACAHSTTAKHCVLHMVEWMEGKALECSMRKGLRQGHAACPSFTSP
eukprot:scaffold100277_cov30-Tisochrysis_lutea.AAC.6